MGASKRAAKTEATRAQLLTAAYDVFSERGYERTTVAAITSAASTGHGTFYLHFKNKEDVFMALVEGVVLEIYDQGFAGEHPTLRQMLEAYVGNLQRHGPIWRCLLSASLTSERVRTVWSELRHGFVRRIEVDLVVNDSVPGLDTVAAANAIGSMIEWTATTQFLVQLPKLQGITEEDTLEVLTQFWHRLVTPSRVP